MAWLAKFEDGYWDTDVCQDEISVGDECTIDTLDETSDQRAQDMHANAVEFIATKMKEGSL
jgi:hypothetical protein